MHTLIAGVFCVFKQVLTINFDLILTDCEQVDTGTKNIQVSPANAGAGFGVVITVRCSPGSVFTEAKYRTQPSVTVTCLLGGTWDITPFPECARKFFNILHTNFGFHEWLKMINHHATMPLLSPS